MSEVNRYVSNVVFVYFKIQFHQFVKNTEGVDIKGNEKDKNQINGEISNKKKEHVTYMKIETTKKKRKKVKIRKEVSKEEENVFSMN